MLLQRAAASHLPLQLQPQAHAAATVATAAAVATASVTAAAAVRTTADSCEAAAAATAAASASQPLPLLPAAATRGIRGCGNVRLSSCTNTAATAAPAVLRPHITRFYEKPKKHL